MSASLLADLLDRVGPQGLLTGADTAGYRGDLARPDGAAFVAVVRPATTAQVSAVLSLCRARGVVVTPRGGGTGLAGGATPADQRPGVVLSLERMTAIRAVEPVGNYLIVEAGVTLHAAQHAAREAGRLLGLDHGGAGSSQIGGNLSTNAGGDNVLRYGMARDQVLGLEAVLVDGTVLDLLRPLRKNNAGYDLKQLFLGTEGTLGVITAACLRLRPAPSRRSTAFLAIDSPAAALAMLERTLETLGETVTAFELLPRTALELHFAHSGTRREPFSPLGDWSLLIEADTAASDFDIEAALNRLLETALEDGLVTDGAIAGSEAQREAFWRLREGAAIAMIETPGTLKSDTAVPLSAIPGFIAAATQAVLAIAPACRPVPFGHIGDGNIHFNVLPPADGELAAFIGILPDLAMVIEDTAIALGGTISAEHGVGSLKRAALRRMLPEPQLDLMGQIKRLLDPDNLLNPGKVV